MINQHRNLIILFADHKFELKDMIQVTHYIIKNPEIPLITCTYRVYQEKFIVGKYSRNERAGKICHNF